MTDPGDLLKAAAPRHASPDMTVILARARHLRGREQLTRLSAVLVGVVAASALAFTALSDPTDALVGPAIAPTAAATQTTPLPSPTVAASDEPASDQPANDEQRALIDALRAFALDPTAENFEQLPLAPEVRLGLGSELLPAAPSARLADPQAWDIERSLYNAYTGPFTALTFLRSTETYKTAVGPHRHCASPPQPLPPDVATLTQVSTQPTEMRSCLEWYTVDVFVDQGVIHAITLDFYEP